MKITKTQLKQIIAEELARLTEADWDHPPEPAGSLGGYGDTDLYGVDDERDFEAESAEFEDDFAETMRGLEEELLDALRGAGPISWSPRDIADAAQVAAEFSRGSDKEVYEALIRHFRSKKRMA